MTREVDGHFDPCMQSIARPIHHHRGRPSLVRLKVHTEMQSDVNTEISGKLPLITIKL